MMALLDTLRNLAPGEHGQDVSGRLRTDGHSGCEARIAGTWPFLGPRSGLVRLMGALGIAMISGWSLMGQPAPDARPGLIVNRPDPAREWVKTRMGEVMKWLETPTRDPLEGAVWGFSLLEGGMYEGAPWKLWLRLGPDGHAHVRLRRPLSDLFAQVQRLHVRHPQEEVADLCARLALVDVDLPDDRLKDLHVAEIAASWSALAPPDPATLEAMERPCDSWWEWRFKGGLPRRAYGAGSLVLALGRGIAPHWVALDERGQPAEGMSANQEMNLLVAWTDALAGRCQERFWEGQARSAYGGMLTRQGLEDLGPLWMGHALAWEDLGLLRALLARGVGPNDLDPEGRLPLNRAAHRLDLSKELLEAGADPKGVDAFRRTPLMFAAEQGALEVVRLLVEKGCPMATRDHWGRTALDWALPDAASDDPAYRDRLETIVSILLAQGAPRGNRDWEGESTLARARRLGRTGIVKRLLEAGARDE